MDREQLSHIQHIQDASKQGRLVIFVGAGVSANSGVPMWKELIDEFKKELPEELNKETDYLKIAELYKTSRRHKEYMDKVKSVLKYRSTLPNPIHKAILDLKPCHIITTNYDDLIEQTIEKTFSPYDIVRQDTDLPNMQYPNAIIKMHGDFDTDNIVLTERDYYNYVRNFPLIRSYILSLFASKLVLFVGFSLTDLNLKLILNDVRESLNEKMQPVYLYTDVSPDSVSFRYFADRKINIILYADEMPSVKDADLIGNIHGKNMLKGLSFIKNYKQELDAIEYIYSYLDKYKLELRSFGEGIRHFLPQGMHPHFYSKGIQIFANKTYPISNEKSFSELRRLVNRYPNIDWRQFKRFAYYNNIYEVEFSCPSDCYEKNIGGIKVKCHSIDSKLFFGKNTFKDLSRLIPVSVFDNMQEFDFDKVNVKLSYLRLRELNGTIFDLEYPCLLYKLGRYEDAYEQYNTVWPLAWKRKKYIVFFICLYNIFYMRDKLLISILRESENELEVISNKIDEINLDEVLSKIHIEEPVKKVLYDLVNSKTTKRHTLKATELNTQIHKCRKSAENGGISMNSHIDSLVSAYINELNFFEFNFMIGDTNDYYKGLSHQTVAGILNSHATPATSMDGSKFIQTTRIDALRPVDIYILIFAVENKGLKEICKEYDIRSLLLEHESVVCLNKYLGNIANTKVLNIMDMSILADQVANLLFIVSKSQCNVDIVLLYTVVLKLWNVLSHPKFDFYLTLKQLVKKHKPDTETAQTLIRNIINNSDESMQKNYFNVVFLLCSICDEENHGISIPKETFTKSKNIDYLFPVIKVLADKEKLDIANYCAEKAQYLWSYVNLIWENKNIQPSSDKLQDLLNGDKSSDRPSVFYLLAKMYMDSHYHEIHESIFELSKSDACMTFLLDPLHYTDYDCVKVEWLWVLPKHIKIALMTIPHYKNMVKQYIADNKLDKESLEYLTSLL